MGNPARLLGADEHIVIRIRPHWKTLVGPIVVFVAASAAAAYLALLVPESDWQPWLRLAIAVAWLLIVLTWALRPLFVWWYTQYTVTNKRLMLRTGVFSRTGHDIPLQRINDVSFQRTWFERILGSGTLHVESASERGPLKLVDIPHVEEVQRDINELAMLDDRQGQPEEESDQPTRPPDDERAQGG